LVFEVLGGLVSELGLALVLVLALELGLGLAGSGEIYDSKGIPSHTSRMELNEEGETKMRGEGGDTRFAAASESKVT